MKIKFIQGIEGAQKPTKVADGIYMLFAATEPKLIQPIDGNINAVYTSGYGIEIEGGGLAMVTPLNDISSKTLSSSPVFINHGEISGLFELTNKTLPPIMYKKGEPFALMVLITPANAEEIIENNTDNEEQQSDNEELPQVEVVESVENA